MRRIHTLAGLIVLFALFTIVTPPALGQTLGGIAGVVRVECNACRPGTEIQTDQLGEFLAKNLTVAFGTDMRPLSVRLRLELFDVARPGEGLGTFLSEAVRVEPGKTYSGETFIKPESRTYDAFAPGFGDRRKIGFTGFGVWESIEEMWRARECGDATNAVRMTLVVDERALPGQTYLCLNVER